MAPIEANTTLGPASVTNAKKRSGVSCNMSKCNGEGVSCSSSHTHTHTLCVVLPCLCTCTRRARRDVADHATPGPAAQRSAGQSTVWATPRPRRHHLRLSHHSLLGPGWDCHTFHTLWLHQSCGMCTRRMPKLRCCWCCCCCCFGLPMTRLPLLPSS